MVLKAERERVKALLTEAITVLCKNGLGYKYTCAIEGLLGITLDDDDVFLVNINESIQKAERPPPVEESTKQETGTQSPASSSPSGTPRRRRRRSQEGEAGHSPAKRANYGTGEQDHSRTQPQSREDVIVIKEEVSETEFSDFYGDTGGGDNEDSGQYVMQQGDQQYPGAGCSQWDTSQTQGGQSDWPAFNPTQQQQAAISQAATSAMMSPSQIVAGSRPCGNLKSPEVRAVLRQHLVLPMLQHPQYTVTALRLSWFNQSVDYLNQVTEQLVPLRAQLDEYMKHLGGVHMFISAVTATRSGAKKDTDMKIYPGVAYWVVMDAASFSQRHLCSYLQESASKPTLKLLLQPYQQAEKDLTVAITSVLKDSMEGVVRRLVDYSAQIPSSSRFPCGNLKSPEVRQVLDDWVVRPLSQHPRYSISAVRLSWFNQSAEYLDRVTEQLISLREQLDNYMKALPGVQMFISAVTATRSGQKKDQRASEMRIYPGVSYWIVLDREGFNHCNLCHYLQGTGLGTTMKLLLQPFQQEVKDIKTALYSVLKDSLEGVVRRLVDLSAQMAPSSGRLSTSDAMLPRSSLRSPQAKEALSQFLVDPFVSPAYKISAFRVTWFNQSPEILQGLWDQIVDLRDQFDEAVTRLPGVQVCLSAVTATSSAVKKDQDPSERRIYPGVAYWMVTPMGGFNERVLYETVTQYAMGANMKLLLQPHQNSRKDACNALHTVVKDSMEGCVRRLVEASAAKGYIRHGEQGVIVKLHVLADGHREAMKRAQAELFNVRFDLTLV